MNGSRITKCIYCGNKAESKDHLPPKLLLEKPLPNNCATVPACSGCNAGFSKDEEYFLAVLAFTSDAPALRTRVAHGGKVQRALQKAPGFAARIKQQVTKTAEGHIGIEPQHPRVNRVIAKIACGLDHIRGRTTAPDQFDVLTYPVKPPNKIPDDIRDLGSNDLNWTVFQPGVFSYLWIDSFRGWPCCVIDFHGTLRGLAMITGGLLSRKGIVPGTRKPT